MAHMAAETESYQEQITLLHNALLSMRSDRWLRPPDNLRITVRQAYREHYRPQVKKSPLSWFECIFAPKTRLALVGASAMVIVVILGAILFAPKGPEQDHYATAVKVHGMVEFKPAGSKEWLPLNEGMELKSSDRIRSGPDSMSTLRFPDGSEAEMGAVTQIAIFQLSSGQGGEGQIIVLHQYIGKTLFEIQPQDPSNSRFEVESSSASITVVGTIFTVEVTEYQATLVTVGEGAVLLKGQDSVIRVEAGQSAYVLPGEGPAHGAPALSSVPPCTQVEITEIQELCSEQAQDSQTSAPSAAQSPSLNDPSSAGMAGISTPANDQGQPTATSTPTSGSAATPRGIYPPGISSPTATTLPSGFPTSQGGSAATLPTSTSVPPTLTPPYPTATPYYPPTSTPPPPSATPIPPTATPVPPTWTPPPPTATPLPPTPTTPPPTPTVPPPSPTTPPPTPTTPPPTPTPPPYP
jgi:hypothetical protein